MKLWNITPLWAGATYKISIRGWWRLLLKQPLSFHSASVIIPGTLTLINGLYFSIPLKNFKTHLNSIQILHILFQLLKQQCNQYWHPQAWVWPLTIIKYFFIIYILSGLLKRRERSRDRNTLLLYVH